MLKSVLTLRQKRTNHAVYYSPLSISQWQTVYHMTIPFVAVVILNINNISYITIMSFLKDLKANHVQIFLAIYYSRNCDCHNLVVLNLCPLIIQCTS